MKNRYIVAVIILIVALLGLTSRANAHELTTEVIKLECAAAIQSTLDRHEDEDLTHFRIEAVIPILKNVYAIDLVIYEGVDIAYCGFNRNMTALVAPDLGIIKAWAF